jgi:general secretion pathway protein D/MSHA biogenesis protein MshL
LRRFRFLPEISFTSKKSRKTAIMKKKTLSVANFFVCAAISLLLTTACAPASQTEATHDSLATKGKPTNPQGAGQLPVRFQKPAYMLGESSAQNIGTAGAEGLTIPVGADISSNTGPVALRDIMKSLAALKGMNISWASDVDQMAMVDVDIRAEDDFFKSMAGILRQKDYFHEVQGNSIVVKYRETKKFHVAMPFTKSTYETGVGGDVLGSGGVGGQSSSGKMTGSIQLKSAGNEFDIWDNIRKNLDQILEIWEETVVTSAAATPAGQPATATPPQTTATTKRNVQGGKGYYTIDKPIGLITVTAPRPLVEKINTYLESLKKELYRQVTIEAKIVEVTINDTEKKGIDWSKLLSTSVNMEMFGPSGIIYQQKSLPQILTTATTSDDGATLTTQTDTTSSYTTNAAGRRMVSKLALAGSPFAVLISALETQGPTNILANPKISVLNGQPALISIGENVRFIEKIETTATDTAVTTAVTTNNVMSGLGMSVIASIMDNDEIVLSMTPVTSSLSKMDERTFGAGLMVQLPTVNVREMNTLVRIKNGDILMIGGLIDNIETSDITKVPVLGDIPGISRLFSHTTKTTKKKELVILLQPKIL